LSQKINLCETLFLLPDPSIRSLRDALGANGERELFRPEAICFW